MHHVKKASTRFCNIDKSLVSLKDFIRSNSLRKVDVSNMHVKTHGTKICNDRIDEMMLNGAYVYFKDGIFVIYKDNYLERKCRNCKEIKRNSAFIFSKTKNSYLINCKLCMNTHSTCKRYNKEKYYKKYSAKKKALRLKNPNDKLSIKEYLKFKNCPLRIENQMEKIECDYVEVNDNISNYQKKYNTAGGRKRLSEALKRDEEYLNEQRIFT